MGKKNKAGKSGKVYKKSALKEMTLPDLRKVCKAAGISCAGKRPPDLIREILKMQSGGTSSADSGEKSGAKKKKKTGAKKKASKGKEDEPEEAEDIDVAAAIAAFEKGLKALDKRVSAIEELVEDDEDVPDEDEPGDDDDPDESGDEDPPDEDDEDPDDDDEDDEDDEDEEEDGDEDVTELEISAKELKEAGIKRLQEIAKAINKGAGEKVLDASLKSAKVLRKNIREFLEENGEKEVEEENAEKTTGKKPSWLKKGVKCRALYEDDWYEVTVDKVGKKMATVTFEEDGEEAEIEFAALKKGKK